MLELVDKDLLLGSGILDQVGLAADGEKIDMNADQLVRMRVAHARGGDAAPVAALDREALVAERVGHELGEKSAISSTPKRFCPGRNERP